MKPILSVPLSLSLVLAARAQDIPVYFTPTQTVEAWCQVQNCCLQSIGVRHVAVVKKGSCQDCAYKITPEVAWNTLVGDEDGDAAYYNPALFGEIDALLIRHGASARVTMRDMYISVKARVGTAVSGLPGLRPGDVASIQRTLADGRIVHFLRVEQIKSALGIPDPIGAIDLDAVAQDAAGNVYLSLDASHNVQLEQNGVVTPFVLADGAVAVIPASAITYDARGNVSAVLANRGLILLTEPQVDALVAHSGVNDHLGNPVTAIGDLDALEVDPNGGTLALQWGNASFTFANLAFGGERLTGLAVLTTDGGGSILRLGPVPCCLARGGGACPAGPSTGFEMGVQAVGGGATAASLNSLAIVPTPEPSNFVVGTCSPEVASPGTFAVGIQGAIAPTFLIMAAGPTAAGGVAPSIASPWTPPGHFPDMFISGLFLMPMVGGSSVTFSVPPGLAMNLVLQAVNVSGGSVDFSAPATIVIR